MTTFGFEKRVSSREARKLVPFREFVDAGEIKSEPVLEIGVHQIRFAYAPSAVDDNELRFKEAGAAVQFVAFFAPSDQHEIIHGFMNRRRLENQ